MFPITWERFVTWLVTGANGLLGSNAGLSLPHPIGITRSGEVGFGFSRGVAGDLTHASAVALEVRSLRPTVVLHAAAMASHEACAAHPERAHLVNAVATGVLAEAAAEVGAAFIYVSTDAVFDGSHGNYAEHDEPNPFSVYGETKLAGELRARECHPAPLIARVNFFGWSPSGQRSILEFFVNQLRLGHRVQGYSDITVTSMYVRDLLKSLEGLIARKVTGIVHLASRDALPKASFGRLVAGEFGLDPLLIQEVQTGGSRFGFGRALDLSLDTTLAASLLGAMPTQASGITEARRDEAETRSLLKALP